MRLNLFTKIYVRGKIFLGKNVISYFLLRFLIKPQMNNENNLDFKYSRRSKVVFLVEIFLE